MVGVTVMVTMGGTGVENQESGAGSVGGVALLSIWRVSACGKEIALSGKGVDENATISGSAVEAVSGVIVSCWMLATGEENTCGADVSKPAWNPSFSDGPFNTIKRSPLMNSEKIIVTAISLNFIFHKANGAFWSASQLYRICRKPIPEPAE